MINKSVFEIDLIVGMQQELRKQGSTEAPNLVKAGECLHTALEILEEAGFQAHADRILNIMYKIAQDTSTKHVQKMPTVAKLMEHGLTHKDIADFNKGDHGAKIRMNLVLRKMGLNEEEIAQFIGKHNVVPEHELLAYQKFNRWMQNPKEDETLGPGQTIKMDPLQNVGPQVPFSSQLEGEQVEDPSIPTELSFKSVADKHHSHPDKINDIHTKKLTPAKMLANLKHHGTEFNMPDLNWSDFDPELAEALGGKNPGELPQEDESEDWDLDLSDDLLQASDPQPLEDFEDEVSR